MWRIRLLTAVLACALLATACTGAPGREREADELRSAVEAMPGVSSVWMRYSNDVFGGTIFDLTVHMDEATDVQIGAVAAKIDELRRDDFAEYDKTLRIAIGRHTTLVLGAEFDRVQEAAGLARALRSHVDAASVEWRIRGESWSVDVREAADPAVALDAVLRVLGGQPAAIDVSPAVHSQGAHWRVDAGFAAADKARIDRQLAAVPGRPSWVGIRDGRLTQLTFGISNPAAAYEDVVAAVRAVGAGPDRPVDLLWAWSDDPAKSGEPRFAGSAQIGTCTADKNRGSAAGRLVPAAADLQRRIRDEYETCP
ncbi:hypothetical protein ACRCUN_07560 [Mycobacterium sp. LTG2003]